VGAFVERFDEQLDNFNLNLKAFHGTPRRVLWVSLGGFFSVATRCRPRATAARRRPLRP
jgi:hypothetical protein